MALNVATKLPSVDHVSSEESSSPGVNISVIADVKITCCNDEEATGTTEDPKVEIVTNLDPSFKEETQNKTTDKCETSKSKSLVPQTSLSGDIKQPIIRRSLKRTQLNCSHIKHDIGNQRKQIERKVILPYFGCSRKSYVRETLNKRYNFVKPSNSWENVTMSCRKIRRKVNFRSKSLDAFSKINDTVPVTDNQLSIFEDLLSFKLDKSQLPTPSSNINRTTAMRSFYHIEDLQSGSQILFDDEKRIKYLCTPISELVKNGFTDCPETDRQKSILNKNILSGTKNVKYKSPNLSYSPKSTRNVSILHRPHMRSQATSTSSLNIPIKSDNIVEESIRGLLLPYVTEGKDFPSELVLKLIPKKEALDKRKPGKDKAKTKKDANNSNSSDSDVLVPMMTTPTKQRKAKKGKGLFGFFSRSKKKSNDNILESLNNGPKVYYPSYVEVHEKN